MRLEINKPKIYAAGDLHGEFGMIQYCFNRMGISDCVFFVCGDIGMGFHKGMYYVQTFKRLEKTLKERNIELVFFRGNHDDPFYFKEETIRNYSPYIHFIPDWSIVTINGINVLCVGGGVSIDRRKRIETNLYFKNQYLKYHKRYDDRAVQKVYWEDELPYYHPTFMEELQDKIDIVLTHSCPHFCVPTNKYGVGYWTVIDKDLDKDLDFERVIFTQLYNELQKKNNLPKVWCYGHFHLHHDAVIEDGNNSVRFVALNCFNQYDYIDLTYINNEILPIQRNE